MQKVFVDYHQLANGYLLDRFKIKELSFSILLALIKFDCLTIDQITMLLNKNSTSTVYRSIKTLLDKKIVFKRNTRYSKDLYYLSGFGKQIVFNTKKKYVLKTDIYASEFHNQVIINWIIDNDINWKNEIITDFEIRNQNLAINKIPDLIIDKKMKITNDNKVEYYIDKDSAIEFELSLKTKKRYAEIFKKYEYALQNKEFRNVIYLCNKETYNSILKLKKELIFNGELLVLKIPDELLTLKK